MNRSSPTLDAPPAGPFTDVQKEYLSGFMAGIAQRQLYPYVGEAGNGQLTADPAQGGSNLAAPREETIFGTPISDCTKQELWKRELHGLDSWERLLQHAEENKFPDEADTFRFRYHGLFYVAPAQNSFMLRCRIPAGELTSAQMRGLADIAESFGNGKAAITTRSNLQIREIAPNNLINVLTKLSSIGLTSRGSGVDNVRNITASPTAGIDPQELLDVRPFAHALHHYILNHRGLYDLPRKFNVAFEGGGAVDTVADTNDIGFMAVKVAQVSKPAVSPISKSAGLGNDGRVAGFETRDTADLEVCATPAPGVFFRVELCGITGHKQFARDAGILIKPNEAVAVAAAMLRVFIEHGDRTDRKKARLKYLVDKWGAERFLNETQRKLAFPIVKFPAELCQKRPPSIRHGHIGVYRQKQPAKNYIGVVIPVGVMTVRQMRRLAQLAENYGSGQLRLTPWQNLLIPDVPDAFVETVKRQLVRMGFHYEATNILGGLVACTGNKGCKWSSTDTKGQAVALGEYLNKRITLDQPINIHLTGCPNSCAQHYMGDIGLQGVKVNVGGESVEGYHIVFGGGYGHTQAVAKQVFTGIPFSEIPTLLEKVLKVYQARRQSGESFAEFTRRHPVKQLQEMFSQ
jgi:ferredoxin-nitrite reductase